MSAAKKPKAKPLTAEQKFAKEVRRLLKPLHEELEEIRILHATMNRRLDKIDSRTRCINSEVDEKVTFLGKIISTDRADFKSQLHGIAETHGTILHMLESIKIKPDCPPEH